MQNSSVQGNYAANPGVSNNNPTSTGKAASASSMDTAKFMQLLMAQLTHQNPMEPMKDAEMMAQMAQLNSLQELQKISQAMSEMALSNQAGYAASLIGKTVRADDGVSTTAGTVTGVTLEGGKMFVQVGELSFPLDQIHEIKGAPANE